MKIQILVTLEMTEPDAEQARKFVRETLDYVLDRGDSLCERLNSAGPIQLHEDTDIHVGQPPYAELLAALKSIEAARDYNDNHGEYPPNTLGVDQCFDDWAADLATAAISRAETATPEPQEDISDNLRRGEMG